MLDLNEQLLDALESDANRPTAEDVAYLRAGLERWRAQMAALRQRLVGLTIVPPDSAAVVGWRFSTLSLYFPT
jgi:hypothetical protein